MPIYEYTCNACGSKFAKFVRSAGGEIEVKCPECGQGDCERKFSTFASSSSGSGGSSAGSSCGSGISRGRFT